MCVGILGLLAVTNAQAIDTIVAINKPLSLQPEIEVVTYYDPDWFTGYHTIVRKLKHPSRENSDYSIESMVTSQTWFYAQNDLILASCNILMKSIDNLMGQLDNIAAARLNEMRQCRLWMDSSDSDSDNTNRRRDERKTRTRRRSQDSP